MEFSVISKAGLETGRRVDLTDEVFGIEVNEHAMYLDVKHYLAAQRQGTHKSKERAEVAYSTKKLKKQKGTGGARAGSIKSPVFVGGGRVFGPRPRSYDFKLNKKVKRLARRSAFAAKAQAGAITVLESFSFDKPSTKQYIDLLAGLQLSDKKTLYILAEADKNVYLSSRNLQRTEVMTVDMLNTYNVMHADQIIVAESAVEPLTQLLSL
jgi:large subunit ribosomal protein L4